MDTVKLTGRWHWWIENPDGSIADSGDINNSAVNQGLNHILNTEFSAGTQITTWYIGLIDAPSFSSFSAGDTAASHAGWTENQAYAEANRQTWGAGAASSQSITNASPAVFTINANNTQIKGFFVVSSNVKGGAAGTLWSEGAFAGGIQTLQSGQLLKCTYTANAASS